jgi:hypothetical protein
MGAVYEAYDRDTGAVVALKLLLRRESEWLLRFKKEFRALADIEHPNMVRLGELHCEDGQWYFTMELICGLTFLDYIRAGPPNQTPDGTRDERPAAKISAGASGAVAAAARMAADDASDDTRSSAIESFGDADLTQSSASRRCTHDPHDPYAMDSAASGAGVTAMA